MTGHDGCPDPRSRLQRARSDPKEGGPKHDQAYQRKGTRILQQITGSESKFGRGAKRDLQPDLPEDGGAGPFSIRPGTKAAKAHRWRGLRMPSHSFALRLTTCLGSLHPRKPWECRGPVTLLR